MTIHATLPTHTTFRRLHSTFIDGRLYHVYRSESRATIIAIPV